MTLNNAEAIFEDETAFSEHTQFLQDVLSGLRQTPKQLPCKYFYDERGSILFTEICNTPEYYITRTELALLDEILPEVANLIGENANVIEYGSGEGRKIRRLLAALKQPKSYTPIDISPEILLRSAIRLKHEFPNIEIHPVVGDYTQEVELPITLQSDHRNPRLVFFPGSTISNFNPDEVRSFLTNVRSLLQPGDGFLLGVDLVKSPRVLHDAYNDKEGVTADFNLNLLRRINNEFEADFDRHQFEHYAFFNPQASRVEMHLVSLVRQVVTIAGQKFYFEAGETIHTENSYKHSIESVAALAAQCGFAHSRAWTDRKDLFSIHYLTHM